MHTCNLDDAGLRLQPVLCTSWMYFMDVLHSCTSELYQVGSRWQDVPAMTWLVSVAKSTLSAPLTTHPHARVSPRSCGGHPRRGPDPQPVEGHHQAPLPASAHRLHHGPLVSSCVWIRDAGWGEVLSEGVHGLTCLLLLIVPLSLRLLPCLTFYLVCIPCLAAQFLCMPCDGGVPCAAFSSGLKKR